MQFLANTFWRTGAPKGAGESSSCSRPGRPRGVATAGGHFDFMDVETARGSISSRFMLYAYRVNVILASIAFVVDASFSNTQFLFVVDVDTPARSSSSRECTHQCARCAEIGRRIKFVPPAVHSVHWPLHSGVRSGACTHGHCGTQRCASTATGSNILYFIIKLIAVKD